jgi:hypothetical protein
VNVGGSSHRFGVVNDGYGVPDRLISIRTRSPLGRLTLLSEGFPQDAQKGRPARPQASRNRRRTLGGYVEDFDEPRTKLEDFFSILLGELVLCHAIPERIARDLEEPAGFGNIAACSLQRFC